MSKKENHYHHGDLRATLLAVAARMIAEKGVEGVTMRGLAEQIGVSRTAPYRHFVDKAALLAAVAEDGFNRLNARVRDAKTQNAGDPLLSFRQMCLVYVEFAVENPTHYRLMFGQEVLNRQEYPGLADAAEVIRNETVAVIQQCQQEQKIKPGHGLAGQFLLEGIPNILKVLISATTEERVKLVMEREKVSKTEALKAIKKFDKERKKWAMYFHGKDPWACRSPLSQ